GVLRGLHDRLAVEELHLRPPGAVGPATAGGPVHRRGDAAEIGAEQHAVHADGPERGEHALDHVGLLGRRENRGLGDQAADVATGERVGYHADDRITQGTHLLAPLCANAAEKGIAVSWNRRGRAPPGPREGLSPPPRCTSFLAGSKTVSWRVRNAGPGLRWR